MGASGGTAKHMMVSNISQQAMSLRLHTMDNQSSIVGLQGLLVQLTDHGRVPFFPARGISRGTGEAEHVARERSLSRLQALTRQHNFDSIVHC